MTQLALVIDLNVCVGCHACVTSCKEWNTSGSAGPLADFNPYDKDPTGTFFNRVQTFEVGQYPDTQTVHFPKSCLHCEDPPCVPVCPTGASSPLNRRGCAIPKWADVWERPTPWRLCGKTVRSSQATYSKGSIRADCASGAVPFGGSDVDRSEYRVRG